MNYDVITFGTATRDIFIRSSAFETHESAGPDHHLEACFMLGAKIDVQEMIFETGGGATNAAVTFNNLGWKAATVAAIGDDLVGKQVMAELKERGVSPSLMQVIPKMSTTSSVIILSGSGERTILVRRGSKTIDPKKIDWKKINAKWFYCSSFGGDIATMKKVIDRAEEIGAKVAWNPGNKELADGLAKLKPLIKRISILNINKEEGAELTGREPSDLNGIISDLRQLPKEALIITDSRAGAYAATKNEALHAGIVDVPRINTTGAGDAFGSGLIAGLMRKNDLAYGLAVGTWNATGVVQAMGAKTGLMRKYPSDKMIKQVPIQKI